MCKTHSRDLRVLLAANKQHRFMYPMIVFTENETVLPKAEHTSLLGSTSKSLVEEHQLSHCVLEAQFSKSMS